MTFGGVGLVTISLLYTRLHNRWMNVIRKLLDFTKYGKPEDFSRTVRLTNFLLKFFLSYGFLGTTVYVYEAIIKIPYCQKVNEERQLGLICAFTGLWLPFSIPITNLSRSMIFIIQSTLAYAVVIPSPVVFFFTWEVIEVVTTHIGHLRKNILECTQIETHDCENMELRTLIQYHIHILG